MTVNGFQDRIVAEIEKIGFEAEVIGSSSAEKAVLTISNMTCTSCSNKVETALLKKPGVIHATVNYLTNQAEVRAPRF